MFDFHQSLHDEYGERDEDKFYEYVDGLMAEFVESPEAQPIRERFGGCGWAGTMMEFADNYIGTSPAEMTRRDFEEVVFELFPLKMSTEPDRAEGIIAELRAFWSFVLRQYGANNARAILEALDDTAGNRLYQLLADPANYGMAKSIFLLGKQSGFDMTNPKELAKFSAVYNAELAAIHCVPPEVTRLTEGPNLPPLQRPTGEELKKRRKEKRKQREAKKRNRR
jgi:hypothetical protein